MRLVIIVVAVVVVLLALLFFFPSDWVKWLQDRNGAVQAIVVVILAGVTAYYAHQTRIQAEANAKMAQEMSEQRYAECLPLLIPEVNPSIVQGADPSTVLFLDLQTGVNVTWANHGKGVAVNSRFSLWGAPLDSHPGDVLFYPPDESKALGIGKREEIRFLGNHTYELVNTAKSPGPRLVAEYEDIYDRKVTSIQEFRLDEQKKKAYFGDLYFEISGKRLGEEVSRYDS